jgi:hypothetical protein
MRDIQGAICGVRVSVSLRLLYIMFSFREDSKWCSYLVHVAGTVAEMGAFGSKINAYHILIARG